MYIVNGKLPWSVIYLYIDLIILYKSGFEISTFNITLCIYYPRLLMKKTLKEYDWKNMFTVEKLCFFDWSDVNMAPLVGQIGQIWTKSKFVVDHLRANGQPLACVPQVCCESTEPQGSYRLH